MVGGLLPEQVQLHPGKTSHVGKHLSITVLTSIREHGWMKLTLCTEVRTSRPSSAPPQDLGLLWGLFPSWSRPSVRTECRGRGKESWGEKGLRVGSRYPQLEGRGGRQRFPS